MNWHDPSIWVAIIPGIVVILGAIGLAYRIIRGTVRFFRRGVHLMDDLQGEEARPGIPARPGVLERIAQIEHQFETNDGHTMRDALDRVEQKADAAAALAAQSTRATERAIQQHIWHVEKLHIPDPEHYPVPPTDD